MTRALLHQDDSFDLAMETEPNEADELQREVAELRSKVAEVEAAFQADREAEREAALRKANAREAMRAKLEAENDAAQLRHSAAKFAAEEALSFQSAVERTSHTACDPLLRQLEFGRSTLSEERAEAERLLQPAAKRAAQVAAEQKEIVELQAYVASLSEEVAAVNARRESAAEEAAVQTARWGSLCRVLLAHAHADALAVEEKIFLASVRESEAAAEAWRMRHAAEAEAAARHEGEVLTMCEDMAQLETDVRSVVAEFVDRWSAGGMW